MTQFFLQRIDDDGSLRDKLQVVCIILYSIRVYCIVRVIVCKRIVLGYTWQRLISGCITIP